MTQDEAKTKWCPFSAEKGTARSNLGNMCLGFQCMLWRWDLPHLNAGDGYCAMGGKTDDTVQRQ